MTLRKHAKEMIAFANGRKVERRYILLSGEWSDWKELKLSIGRSIIFYEGEDYEYRIALEDWQQELVDAVKAGKVVEFEAPSGWMLSDLNRTPDTYTWNNSHKRKDFRIRPEKNDERDEELLEQLYWEFDSDRKKYPENERIRFKGKLRYFANMKLQRVKPDVVYFIYAGANDFSCCMLAPSKEKLPGHNLKLTFDGETSDSKSVELLR